MERGARGWTKFLKIFAGLGALDPPPGRGYAAMMLFELINLRKTRVRREGAPVNGGFRALQTEETKIGASRLPALQAA